MPLNTNIRKVLIIGSGPIVIGQAAEFDYSGTQACQAIKSEQIEVVLINSNPATIMTDKSVADYVYIEPIESSYIEKIIRKERPDSILLGMGGQTALNMGLELKEKGILEKYDVQVIGTSIESIVRGEDREVFRDMMQEINQPVIESVMVASVEEGLEFAMNVGYPLILRPAYTLGGSGGGIAENESELKEILSDGLFQSRTTQVLIEKSIKGWKEIEYEIIRDERGNKVCICNMENMDPVGVHTGDSIVVAPSQTLSDREYHLMREASFKIVDAIEIVGGCNVQFAFNPVTGEYAIIEVNPRVSRSSALASKATGYPIAKVAAKIALGYTLDEIVSEVTGVTYACFEPVLDYVVVKMPRFPFDKFSTASKALGTAMKATGEVMAIGDRFESALLKAMRSLDEKDVVQRIRRYSALETEALYTMALRSEYDQILVLMELLRKGAEADQVSLLTGIDPWFLSKIDNIVQMERVLASTKIEDITKELLLKSKKVGFMDLEISALLNVHATEVHALRRKLNIIPSFRMVDTCGGEFEAISPYYYSVYGGGDRIAHSEKPKVLVVGSGPIRIGQGVEFDYASVHCAKSLQKSGYETLMINNNPETVSTDYSCADRLYFEPLTVEDVMNVVDAENPIGVVLQFGGQTAIQLADGLWERGVNILGMTHDKIRLCEDRHTFDEFLGELGLSRPKGTYIESVTSALNDMNKIEFPVIIRPNFVLGGQGMTICYTQTQLLEQLTANCPVWLDRFIEGREVEVDVITDGDSIFIPGIMEHIEPAGVHSGDSMTVYPPVTLTDDETARIVEITERIAKGLDVKGVLNIQYIIKDQEIMVIEVNPRASRTLPIISKATGLPVVEYATRTMTGGTLKELNILDKVAPIGDKVVVKLPVFSTQKINGADPITGPMMKSTGEIMGIGKSFEEALSKVYTNHLAKKRKNLLITIDEIAKQKLSQWVEEGLFNDMNIYATEGTATVLRELGINALKVDNHENIDMMLNISNVRKLQETKGGTLRIAAAKMNIPIFYTIETFKTWKLASAFNIALANVENL